MARILLLGPPETVAEFAGMIAGAHDIEALLDRPGPMPDGVRIAESLIDIDESVDVAIDLCADEHEKIQASLASHRETLAHARIVIVNGLTTTATAAARTLGMTRVLSTSFLRGVTATAAQLELAPALQCDAAATEEAATLLADITARPVERVEDRIGLISARVLAMVINEAAFAVMEGVASPRDIDTAMKLGTNYPNGPLAWADAIGAATIVRILDALEREYREERYRACVLLRQHALAELPFIGA